MSRVCDKPNIKRRKEMFRSTQRDFMGFFVGLCLGLVLLFGVTASAQGPIVNKVSAGGHDAFGPFARDANYSLIAIEFSDGSVTGQFSDRYSNVNGGGGIHGAVGCLSVSGDEAWVTGVITSASNPNNVGRFFITRVKDNGTSQQDPPDQISFAVPFDNPFFTDCTLHIPLNLWDMPNGQVKVN
jgi:hypothetical protein